MTDPCDVGAIISVEEANASREWIADRVVRIREALGRRERPAARGDWLAPSAGAGAAIPDEVASDVLSLYLMSRQLSAMDVVVRELARGLVDSRSA